MKKISLVVFLLFFTFIEAQPILNASNFVAVYSNRAYKGSTVGFTNGSPGANQVWDYSAMTLIDANLTMSLIPISSMPFQNIFPAVNYCYLINDHGYITYNPYDLSNNSFESLGYIDGNNPVGYSNTAIIFQFPYSYSSTFTDTYLSTIPNATLKTETRTYDAYGTLLTPFGAFTDVIRQKVESAAGVDYFWYDSHTAQIILNGNFSNSQVYFFKDTSNLGITKSEKQVFSIYPIPAKDFISVINTDLPNQETFVSVFDLIGKAIISNEKLSIDNKISLSDLKSGVYILRITDLEDHVLHTEKIIKR